jgi:peptidoglycan/LPS O-acetylase OafA/YrhL
MILLHHAGQRVDVAKISHFLPALLSSFNSGVSVFFVLSGFLLADSFWINFYAEKQIPNLKLYYIRRGARIFPGYFFSLVIPFIFTYFFVGNVPYPWIRFFSGLTFTSCFYWVTTFPVEMNGAVWSISYEVFAYVSLSITMLFIFKFIKVRNFGTAFGSSIIFLIVFLILNNIIQKYSLPPNNNLVVENSLVALSKNKEWWPKTNPFSMIIHFFIGVLGNCAFKYLKPHKYAYDLTGILIMIFIPYLIYFKSWGFYFYNLPYWAPLFPLLIALLILCLTKSNILFKLWDNKVAVFIAKISFGLYVWHHFVYNVFYKYLLYFFLFAGKLHSIAMCLAAYSLTFIIATFSWYCIEKPVASYFKRKYI